MAVSALGRFAAGLRAHRDQECFIRRGSNGPAGFTPSLAEEQAQRKVVFVKTMCAVPAATDPTCDLQGRVDGLVCPVQQDPRILCGWFLGLCVGGVDDGEAPSARLP